MCLCVSRVCMLCVYLSTLCMCEYCVCVYVWAWSVGEMWVCMSIVFWIWFVWAWLYVWCICLHGVCLSMVCMCEYASCICDLVVYVSMVCVKTRCVWRMAYVCAFMCMNIVWDEHSVCVWCVRGWYVWGRSHLEETTQFPMKKRFFPLWNVAFHFNVVIPLSSLVYISALFGKLGKFCCYEGRKCRWVGLK